ncbi:glutamate--cysteine ligase [Labrys monachus]|uniref:Glutamate--cysteine ligase n=1 Tax=Labrys monachus TaxID=217067 RepID=A0ABU0FAC2_9HYPH|nr:glutamate--cysteine ligase [Labrys monachus]MDQ0391569.1 glutamate--cysteine ligase [Labrys monachus]
MARDVIDSTPVASRDELVAWVEQGIKPRSAFRIGTEHEKFPFRAGTHRPVPYEGPNGIRALLEGMQAMLGWEPIMEGDRIIGMLDITGGGAISLEPGGQFELSGAPLPSIHHTCSEIHAHLAQVHEIGTPLGIRFLGLGMSPVWTRQQTPAMPKRRYEIMTSYMPKVGVMGLDMMYRTSTVQVNLDFSSEADMVKKLRVSLALQPIATAIFANSPFMHGRPNGFLAMRSEVWRHTDLDRTGMLPFAFDDGMGFERYVDWALDVPLYFVKRGDIYHDVSGGSFRDLLKGTLPQLPGERATISDWANHLGTLFPEVRLKRYLEMRGADAGPTAKLAALSAFWVGLLYDGDALDAAWDLVKGWRESERLALRDAVPRQALRTPFRNETVRDIALRALAISRKGLQARNVEDWEGRNEAHFLDGLDDMVESGVTAADAMLAKFHGEWGGRIDPVFDEQAY